MLMGLMLPSRSRARWLLALGSVVFGAVLFGFGAGCGANSSPYIQKIPDQNAAVGLELTIQIRATDSDGDSLSYSFNAPELPDLGKRQPPPTLEAFSNGVAIFHFIPNASDSRPAPYEFDFKVSDGKTTSTAVVHITVRDQGGDGAPVFVKPLGSGTTLQLDTTPCLELPVEVSDTDSTMVTIGQEDPLIAGATLSPEGSFTATWKWCPTAEQLAAQDRFYLRLSADDGTNPKTLKLPPFLIVVIGSSKGNNCPGAAPVITHTPLTAQSTVQDLKITMTASDDLGLKSTPLVYWSTTNPGATPDLTKMTPVASTRTSGDATSGSYDGIIPNPVASSPSGTMKTVYYLIVARDNDDPTGGCNHTTLAPDTGVYSFTVTAGGAGGLAACEACTSDAQCGGATDNCVTIAGSLRCALACSATGTCAAGYSCTGAAIVSVDGKSAKQCVPMSGTCTAAQTCTDDSLENNDTQAAITNATAASLPGTSYPGLMICPLAGGGVDEDWFGVPVTQEGQITIAITSTALTDLDLELFDSAGVILAYSLSLTSNESASACVGTGAGKVFARVFSLATAPTAAPYSLSVTKTAMTCPCQPDINEPDDSAAASTPLGRPTTLSSQAGLTLCPGNSDFYAVTLNAGDKLTVDLTFNQATPNNDLDIHFFKPDGVTDLTPCSATQSGCMTTNGQGYQSNEHFVWTVAAGLGGTYYIVIRGYDAADTAPYALGVKVQ